MDNGYTKQVRERISMAEDGTVFATSDFADITASKGCGFQNEILSASMGEIYGGCAGNFETAPTGVPFSCVAGRL